VHKSVAEDVRDVFVALFESKSLAIARMDLIDVFGGNDEASMAANNTSGYNCRKASGSRRLSSHALGLAIDVNPLVNPFVWKKGTSPKGGGGFVGGQIVLGLFASRRCALGVAGEIVFQFLDALVVVDLLHRRDSRAMRASACSKSWRSE
jgi:hypothetical protein